MNDVQNKENSNEESLEIVKVEKTNDKEVSKVVDFFNEFFYGITGLIGANTAATQLFIANNFDIESLPKIKEISALIGMCTSTIIGIGILMKSVDRVFFVRDEDKKENQAKSDKKADEELTIVKAEKTNDRKIASRVNYLRNITFGATALLGANTFITPIILANNFDLSSLPSVQQTAVIISMATSMIVGSDIVKKSGKRMRWGDELKEDNILEGKGMHK